MSHQMCFLYSVFRLNIHVFHAFGIFNVCCIAIYLCCYDNMRVCLLCFFIFVGIYIHVICKHILLVWFSSFTSLKNSFSIQSYNFILGFIDSKTSHPGPSSPHLAGFPMWWEHPGPIKKSNARIQTNVEQVSGASRAPSAVRDDEPVLEKWNKHWGTPVFLCCVFFLTKIFNRYVPKT